MFPEKKLYGVLFALFAAGLLSVCLQFRGGPARMPRLPLSLPMEASGWHGGPLSAVMPREVAPGDYILRSYGVNDGQLLNVLALYSRISNYHPPALCYRGAGGQLTEIPPVGSSSGKIRLAGLMSKRDGNVMLIYHGFYIGGKVIPDGIEKKLYEIKEKLARGSIDQYFLEVTVNSVDGNHATAVGHVKRFLDDMESYLICSDS